MPQWSLSVVIATMDRASYVDRVIGSLRASHVPPQALVVVDSSHGPETRQTVESWSARWPAVQYVSAPRTGCSRARNLGVRATHTDLVLITDDDCLVDAECLGRVLNAFDSEPGVDCVTGAVHPYGDTHKKVGVAITSSRAHRVWQGLNRPWGIGHSVNLTFRRPMYERVAGFDEDMGPGTELRAAEDLDVLYRVLQAGGKIVYEPDAIILHDQWRSRSEARQRRRDYARGTAAFLLKHILVHRDGYVLRLLPRRLWEDVPLLAMIGLAKHNLELELVSFYQLWGLSIGFWVAGWHYGRQLRAASVQRRGG